MRGDPIRQCKDTPTRNYRPPWRPLAGGDERTTKEGELRWVVPLLGLFGTPPTPDHFTRLIHPDAPARGALRQFCVSR